VGKQIKMWPGIRTMVLRVKLLPH